MHKQPSRFGHFVAELKRRHVGRVALGYLAAAFVALQMGEILLPAFGLGERALRLLVGFSALGFPVAVVLAWIFDITRHGIERTDDQVGSRGSGESGGLLLPRLALGGVTVTTAAFAGWWIVGAAGPGTSLESSAPLEPPVAPASFDDTTIRSLAVLPLESFSAGGEQDWFAAGMHDQIVTRLSQLPSLRVVSRTSTMRYQGTELPMPRIAAELGVEGIVEGSVLRSENRVRITVQLIHGPSDTHVWARDYDEEMSDVIELQSRVAQAIAQEIQGELSDEDRDLLASEPGETEPAAQEAFVLGTAELDRGTAEGYQEAAQLFTTALERDSTFAPAMAGLASSRVMLAMGTPGVQLDTVEVRTLAERALALDPDLPEAINVLAFLHDEEPPEDSDLVEEGSASRPSAPVRLFGPGSFTWRSGADSAGPTVQRIVRDLAGRVVMDASGNVRTDFPGATAMSDMALQLQSVGRTQEALDMIGVPTQDLPGASPAWDALEYLHAILGSWERVLEVRERHGAHDADDLEDLREAIEEQGPRGYWELRAEELEEQLDGAGSDPLYFLATALAGAGDADVAFEVLSRAVEAGDPRLSLLRQDPTWDGYRTDARYRDILRQVQIRFGDRPERRRP